MSALDPPRREAARLARLVEEDDVAVGVAQPRLAPHPRLVARAVLERKAGAGEAFDALVRAADSHDARRIVDKDLAFHTAIVALLDSTRLDEFYAELTRELRFYLMVLSVEDREFESPDVLLAEHEAILSAIRSGDPARAVREVRAHIETNAQRLKGILAGREPHAVGKLAHVGGLREDVREQKMVVAAERVPERASKRDAG
mgnify:CR=1 FL=1